MPQGNVYVADRGNRRIQVFDGDGKFLRQIVIDVPFDPNARPAIGNKPQLPVIGNQAMAPGAPWAICITPPPNQVLYSSDGYPGRIYKLTLDGKVLGVLGESGKQLKQFGWIHEIACPSENELFVGELLNWRVQKLILEPVRLTRVSASRRHPRDFSPEGSGVHASALDRAAHALHARCFASSA